MAESPAEPDRKAEAAEDLTRRAKAAVQYLKPTDRLQELNLSLAWIDGYKAALLDIIT